MPGRGVVRFDLVLQVDVARIAYADQLPEDAGHRHLALADDALASVVRVIAQILHVHVQNPAARLPGPLPPRRPRYGAVWPTSTHNPTRGVHSLDHLEPVGGRREMLVLGAVIVDGHGDAVTLDRISPPAA